MHYQIPCESETHLDVKDANRSIWARKKKSCRKAIVTKKRLQFKPKLNNKKQRRENEQR